MDSKCTKNVNISLVKMCSNFKILLSIYFDYMLSKIMHKLDSLHPFLIIIWYIFLFQTDTKKSFKTLGSFFYGLLSH